MDDKKKKFIMPEADLVSFSNDDIITLSGGATQEAMGDGVFGDDDNTEGWLS